MSKERKIELARIFSVAAKSVATQTPVGYWWYWLIEKAAIEVVGNRGVDAVVKARHAAMDVADAYFNTDAPQNLDIDEKVLAFLFLANAVVDSNA